VAEKKGSNLLDFLSQLIAKPETLSRMQQAQQLHKPQPTMQQPTGPLGSGLGQGAANLMQMHPIWAQQYADGTTELQFPDWIRAQGIANPTLPPAQVGTAP
jgi:hypothetical protein